MSSPQVTVVLLGDSECGKSTFLACVNRGNHATPKPVTDKKVVLLRDLDQPFIQDVVLYNRPYRFHFYDTAAADNFTLLRPDLIVMCYDISNKMSLFNVQTGWRKTATLHYQDRIPMMLLGLKRDLRAESAGAVHPQEGYGVAQEMRCDRYAECSSTTGELMTQVCEDIFILGAKTTTEVGALTEPSCMVQ